MDAGIELSLFAFFALPITLIDLREQRIPDLLSVGGTAVFLVFNLLWGQNSIAVLTVRFFIGFGLFWLIWRLTRGGIGLGDAKYSAFIAVALGLPVWSAALFFAALLGLGCAAVLIIALKGDRRERIPFAPFLTAGSVIALAANALHPLGPAFSRFGV